MIGPFVQYEPPGVYTRTLTDNTVVTLQGGLRIPLLIGVGQETLVLSDQEIVRGSSSTTDNLKTNEDVSLQFDGLKREFQTALFPITTGEGTGEATFDSNDVKVTVNGTPIGVSAVNGPEGKITLSVIPREEDEVLVTYFFKRTDTLIGGSAQFPDYDDLSNQVDGINKEFKVSFPPMVDGSNGGIATTDPNKVTVKIIRNGIEYAGEVALVDGQAGVVTLKDAPQINDMVWVSYYTNRWQDTFDWLPVDNITDVLRVGDAPGRSDFINTLDFVIQENRIHWGNSFEVRADQVSTSPGSVAFKEQIQSTLWDAKVYNRLASGLSDGSNKEFLLEFVPTEGTGQGRITDDDSKLVVHVGITLEDALSEDPVEVAKVYGSQRKIVLKEAPLSGHNVYVTYWFNQLGDDVYTITSKKENDPLNPGEFEITSENNGSVLFIEEDNPSHAIQDPNFATEGITWPTEGSDLTTIPGYSVEETILLNFINDKDYLVLSSIGVDGSQGSGTLGQTYVDPKTGVRFTVLKGSTVTYQPGDLLEFDIKKTFKTGPIPTLAIPGLRMTVNDLNGVTPQNSSVLETYNKSGKEPNVGDFYYVSLRYAKTEYDMRIYTKLKDVVADFGDVNTDNRLSLAASLAFGNGAVALACAQVLRDSDGIDASPQAYLDVLKTIESPIEGTQIKPNIICPVTTKQDVINEVRVHCEKMSTIRNKTERTGVFGYQVGTTPEQAQSFARNLKSERMVGLYPDGAIIGLVDEFGSVNEAAVDGSFLASAYAGLAVNPTFDVATPLTHKTLTGFRRLIRTLDSVTMNQTAVSGITVLEDLVPSVLIRQAMTTNPSNVLTREPSVIYIKDFVQQQMRSVLDQFIGQKFLPTVLQDVENSVDNLLNQLVNLQIITAFQGTSAEQDENDPTIMRVETFYSPVFPLNWIVVTLNLRVRL
jgi:hypothetical protein